jgi:hypothetical protein
MFPPDRIPTLNAFADCLIPPDQDAGAVAAGAVAYLLGQFSRDLANYLETYTTGLAALDAESYQLAEMPFMRLPASAQHELLRRISAGEVATPWAIDPVSFIELAAEHIAEGYYSDPGNGGNYNQASWHMIGFTIQE